MSETIRAPKPITGTKYYRYINDQLVMVRYIKIKNDNCYVVEAAGQTFNMAKAEFDSYIKLNPDGYVTFTSVILDESYNVVDESGQVTNMNPLEFDVYKTEAAKKKTKYKADKVAVKDVIVTFHRKQDIGNNIPFAICRMNVYDVFANTLNTEEGVMYVGMSVNIDSCPSDLDYSLMIANNGVENMEMVGVYIEDNLDDILNLVRSIPYDDVLYTLAAGYNSPNNTVKARGVCDNLKMLLEQNHFIDDIYYGFKQLKVQFKYIPEVASDFTRSIEDMIKHTMINPVWLPFTRDIDLDKIEDQYVIIRDIEDNLYIVSYKEGEYVNRPYFNMDDHSEYDELIKLSQNKI